MASSTSLPSTCDKRDCSAEVSSWTYCFLPSSVVRTAVPLSLMVNIADFRLGVNPLISILRLTKASVTVSIFSSLLLFSICILRRSIVMNIFIMESKRPPPSPCPLRAKAESSEDISMVSQSLGVTCCCCVAGGGVSVPPAWYCAKRSLPLY